MLRAWTSKCARWRQPPSMMQGPPELADVFQFVIDLNGSDMEDAHHYQQIFFTGCELSFSRRAIKL